MAELVRDRSKDAVKRITLSAQEMAEKALKVELKDLKAWSEIIPPEEGSGDDATYVISSRDELQLLRKRAALLRTNMSVAAVQEVERAGLLDAYAALATDCPRGITAHIWRSYGVIVLIQMRYGKMIGPAELAQRAGMVTKKGRKETPDVEMAERHLRLLQGLGYLRELNGRWEHKGLPEAWTGSH